MPYNTRESLATAAGIPEERLLFHHVYIGGDFGGKGNARNTPICYFLARATGRPVRMVSDYIEESLVRVTMRMLHSPQYDTASTASRGRASTVAVYGSLTLQLRQVVQRRAARKS